MSLLILLINVAARGLYEVCRRLSTRERGAREGAGKARVHLFKGKVQGSL